MRETLLEFLEDYNSTTTTPMNLVMFDDAMGHICRIARILRQSPGNALLLGMGGSGNLKMFAKKYVINIFITNSLIFMKVFFRLTKQY